MDAERFDAIVIGSGMGGLTAASLLARLRGQRVLVLERHWRLGGFTHAFRRGDFSWDVGLHYVGQMAAGAPPRGLMDLVTGGAVRWNAMPERFEAYDYPGFSFLQRAGAERFRDDLARLFPAELPAIDRYLADVRRAAGWLALRATGGALAGAAGSLARLAARARSGLPLETTGAYLARSFRAPELRALLASQWGDYGLPPARSAFAIHATIVAHYLAGGFYPEGGAGAIAEGAAAVVRGAGGDLLVDHEVREILVERGRAVGVRAVQRRAAPGGGEERVFRAPVVVSDAGAAATLLRLVPGGVPGAARIRADVERLGAPYSYVTLYLGLADGAQALGFEGENRWLYAGLDHDALAARSDELIEGRAHLAYLSFPSLKDPAARGATAELIAPVSREAFARFDGTPWRRRGAAYDAVKARTGGGLLDLVEARHPGFRRLVAYEELSTPLTTEFMTGHAGGAAYGLPAVPERYRLPWLGARTPVPGLYLAGSDAASHGIMGALFGGVMSVAAILGMRSFPEVFKAAKLASRGGAVGAAPGRRRAA
ncbi:MAG: phytoene desaturase family protein [Anaeromyxobacteraceae bacterium]